MGTNYYLQHVNQETKRTRDVHICKTSGGWTPSMQGYRDKDHGWNNEDNWTFKDIRSWRDWKWYLLKETKKGSIIFNEYDEPLTLKEFIGHIESWQEGPSHNSEPKKNHAREAREGAFSEGEMDSHAKACWIDDEGYSFHDGEFS